MWAKPSPLMFGNLNFRTRSERQRCRLNQARLREPLNARTSSNANSGSRHHFPPNDSHHSTTSDATASSMVAYMISTIYEITTRFFLNYSYQVTFRKFIQLVNCLYYLINNIITTILKDRIWDLY